MSKQVVSVGLSVLTVEPNSVSWLMPPSRRSMYVRPEMVMLHDPERATYDGVIEGALSLLLALRSEGVVIDDEKLAKAMATVNDAAVNAGDSDEE